MTIRHLKDILYRNFKGRKTYLFYVIWKNQYSPDARVSDNWNPNVNDLKFAGSCLLTWQETTNDPSIISAGGKKLILQNMSVEHPRYFRVIF